MKPVQQRLTAAALLILAGCHATGERLTYVPNETATPPLTDVTFTPATQPFLPGGVERIAYTSAIDGHDDWGLILPGTRSDWVVMIHGHGSRGDQLFTRPDLRDDWLPDFRRRGLGILTVNLRGNAWMSPAAAADLHALLGMIRERYHVRRFVFASGSMGGTSNLIYAVLHPEDVAGVVALCPATDLASYVQWCRLRAEPAVLQEIADAIVAAYGSPSEDRPQAYARHSAMTNAERLTMPVCIVHGARDVVIPVEQSRALAAKLSGRPSIHYRELPEGDHETPLRHMSWALDWVLR